MATEYISREAAIEAIMEHTGMTPIAKLTAETTICRVPAADVQPVVHATWRDDADKIDKRFNKHDYFCPVCNTRADAFVAGSEDWYCYFAPNFCPNCGADMREAKDGN